MPEEKRRVLIAIAGEYYEDERARRIARTALSAGCEVEVLCLVGKSGREAAEDAGGVRVTRRTAVPRVEPPAAGTPPKSSSGGVIGRFLGFLGDRSASRAFTAPGRAAAAYIEEAGAGCDTVVASGLELLETARFSPSRDGYRLIYDSRGLAPEKYSADHALSNFLYSYEGELIVVADEVVASSAAAAAHLKKKYFLSTEPTTACDAPDAVTADTPAPESGPVKFVCAVPLSPGYGLENLAVAMSAVKDGELTIVGEGPLEDKLRASSADNVRFAAPGSPEADLALYDAGVLAAEGTNLDTYYSLPAVFSDYLAAGLAVCTSRLPQLEKSVEETGAGVLFDVVDVNDIAAKLGGLIADRAGLAAFREKAREAAKETYNWAVQDACFRRAFTRPVAEKKLRVGMLVNNPCENDSRVLREAGSLAANNFDVTVMAVRKEGLPGNEEKDGFKIMRVIPRQLTFFPFSPPRLKAILDVKNIVLNAGFDMVHCNDIDTLYFGHVAKKRLGAPVVYDMHEFWPACDLVDDPYSFARTTANFAAQTFWFSRERIWIHEADEHITVSDELADHMTGHYGIERPTVLYNCPAKVEAPFEDRFRQQFPIQYDWPIVLYQGAIDEGRALFNLIRSVRALPGVALVLMGYGPLEDNIQRYIVDRGLDHRMFVKSAVPPSELLSWTASADIGIALTEDTNFNQRLGSPNKLFEYMNAGLPVIVSDLPVLKRIVDGYKIGLAVDPDDMGQITEAIFRLLNDQAFFSEARENGQKLAAEKFNWQVEEKKLVELYERVARRVRNNGHSKH